MVRRRCRGERGAAAVEFALIAPFLIFLLFGIIGVGFMLSFRQAVSQGASEGARAAATSPGGATAAEKQQRAVNAVNDSLRSYGVSCTTAGALVRNGKTAGTCAVTTVPCTGTATTPVSCARVALDYRYRDNSLLPSVPGLGLVLPDHMRYTAEVQVS